VIGIAPAYADQAIDNLVATSESIRSTFDYGIKAVSGMEVYSSQGGIAPTGFTDQGLVSIQQADDYNLAISSVQQASYVADAGAQQYFDDQAQNAMNNVNVAIDTYVQASSAMIEVVMINDMAAEAQASGDVQQAEALQTYITQNDVTLNQAEVDLYNSSLQGVESATQEAAAFMAIAGDPALIDSANQQASAVSATYAEAGDAFFDAANGDVTVGFETYAMTVTLSVSSYFKASVDILSAGEQGGFYTTGPTANPCFFIQDPVERDECVASNGA